jgi:outer membrane protein assembly factor BamA
MRLNGRGVKACQRRHLRQGLSPMIASPRHRSVQRPSARGWLSLLLVLAALPGWALAAAAVVVRIEIEGNRITQPRVILREMALGVGDPAEPVAIENSRQAIQDLGLFRAVRIAEITEGDGVVLRVHVYEKRYLLPIPRLDGNSDGDYSYGAQLRWSNLLGRNHRLVAYVEEERLESERDRNRARSARLSYAAPYLCDSAYSLGLYLDHTEQRSLTRQDEPFIETFNRVQVLATRDFRDSRPRRGWVLGGGLYWQDQTARGEFAPEPDGAATAAVLTADYRDLRFNIYSQTGRSFSARTELAREGLASDYSYERLDLGFRDQRRIGRREHQTLHLLAAGGIVSGGPRSRNSYSLGGSSRMRGYDRDRIEGDTYWYGSAEYLRPLRWNWLRLIANVEVGGARRNVFGERNRNAYASIGLGLRARITWFVDIELEAGFALPLIDGDGVRFFASTL